MFPVRKQDFRARLLPERDVVGHNDKQTRIKHKIRKRLNISVEMLSILLDYSQLSRIRDQNRILDD